MTTIIGKVRDLVQDILDTTGRQEFDFLSSSSSRVFTLQESNAVASTILVYKNGILWSDDNYTYNAATCQLTVVEESGEELEVGDTLLVTFSFYKKYSDNEIRGFIRAAIAHLSVEKYRTFAVKSDNVIFPTPTEIEENLIAVVASILMKGNIKQYKTPEITVIFNDSESKEKMIANTIRQFNKAFGVLLYIDDKKTSVSDGGELF